MTKTAKIYGDSLYDLAAEEKLTEEILPQMEQIKMCIRDSTYIVSETGTVFYRINSLWPENDKSSDQGDGAEMCIRDREPGIQPYVRDLPEGCPYGPRCPKYREECSKDIPYVPYQGGLVRCICPGDEKEILPGILSESEVLKEKMTSEPSSGECSVCGKEGAGL